MRERLSVEISDGGIRILSGRETVMQITGLTVFFADGSNVSAAADASPTPLDAISSP